MRLFLKRKFLAIFILIFLSLYILIGGIITYVYNVEKKHVLDNMVRSYSGFLEQRGELLQALFTKSISDINHLGHKRSIVDYLEDPRNKPRLVEDMQLFVESNPDYKQVRIIGIDGMEKIRINYQNNNLVIVPDNELQNKSDREYFIKSKQLTQDEIYVSPIDLNIEHGQIEIPHQQVIRMATPIYDRDNRLQGVAVINQYLNDFFKRIKTRDSIAQINFMLLDSAGYWILGPNKYHPYGFMFDKLKNENFPTYFPDAWETILNRQNGSIYSKDGLFVFSNLTLMKSLMKTPQFLLDNLRPDPANNWLMVIYLPRKDITQFAGLSNLFSLSLLGSALIIFFISYTIGRLRFRELQYVSELSNLNKTLEQKIEERTQEILQKNEELKMVNEELESFSYSVSHDLRAPLRHISGFVDLLVKNHKVELTGKGNNYLNYIHEASAEMSRLIDDLLRFSRIGRAELHRVPFEMEQLVREVTASVSKEHNGRDIRWSVSALPRVSGDFALLRQVWSNLLQNAVKYSSKKDFSAIEIAVNEQPEQFIFSVKDNGAGFDMKYSHKLFGPFQRLHSSDDYDGTGIGLAIVRRIIAKHGGSTWAESEVDAGATFYFSLPKTVK